jgi:NitT/TauT family transport system substrate-binding protein
MPVYMVIELRNTPPSSSAENAGPNSPSVLHGLRKNGIDPNSIRAVEVPFPNMPDQLRAGNVDAVEALEPFAGQLLAAGNRSLGDPLLFVSDEVLYTFWISERKWATGKHAVIEACIASLDQAKQFMDAKPQEARAILAKYPKLPEAVVQKIPFVTYRFSLDPRDFAVWEHAERLWPNCPIG